MRAACQPVCAQSKLEELPPPSGMVGIAGMRFAAVLVGAESDSWNGSGWKGPLKVIESNLPAISRDIFNRIRLLSFDPVLQRSWVSWVDVLVLPCASSVEMERTAVEQRHTRLLGARVCGLQVMLRPSKAVPKTWRMEGGCKQGGWK